VLHIVAALQLTRRDRAARPARYAAYTPQAATIASRTMRWGGVLLLAFIIFHILHFTTGTLHPAFVPGNVYANVIRGFQVPWVALFYVVAMLALGLHLYHGAWSSFRTLGVNRASPDPLKHRVSLVLAALLWLGFTIIPLAVLAGVLR
jgi:succinate dehydrogenase / fumarate reductase cytochrome b subunit